MKLRISVVIVSIILLCQFVPIDRSVSKEEAPLIASEEVTSILKRSCYDCHSYQTVWPFYSYVFPISYLISDHINEGRSELNFSNWEKLSLKKKSTAVASILEEIEEGEMPIFSYTIIHRGARLTQTEIEILKKWAEEIDAKYEEETK